MGILKQETDKRFFRINELKLILGVSGASIWAWTRKKTFPRPIKLAENTTVWVASEVEAWMQSRIAASRKVEGNHDNSN